MKHVPRCTRIVVLDGENLVRKSLRIRIDQEPDLEVVGEAGTAAEGISLVKTLLPQIVVMGTHLPDSFGLVTCQEIRELVPHIRILMLTKDASQPTDAASIHSGVQGDALDKSASEIVQTIKTLAVGETYMNPAGAHSVLQSGSSVSVSSVSKLSRQQESIMRLLAQGNTTKEMAHQLNISENTVKNYLAIIFHKLKVHTRKEAVAQFLGI